MVELGKPRDGKEPIRRPRPLGLAPGWTWNDLTDRFRWLRPGVLALAIVFFALPFLTVSCDTPVGLGPDAPGETATYSGFDVAFGGVPHRGDGPITGLPENYAFGPVVYTTITLVLIAAALVVSTLALVVRVRQQSGRGDRPRPGFRTLRHIATATTALALVVHVLAEAVAHRLLLRQVEDAVRAAPDYSAGTDYVHAGQGYVLVTALLVLPLLVSAVSTYSRWHAAREHERSRRRSRGRDESGAEIRAHRQAADDRRIGSTWADVTPRSPLTPRDPARRSHR